MQPYEIADAQTKELIALIDEPLKAIAYYSQTSLTCAKISRMTERLWIRGSASLSDGCGSSFLE